MPATAIKDTVQPIRRDNPIGTDGFEQFRIWQQADGSVDFDNFVVSTIPEPASLALMGLGGLLVLTGGRRRAGLAR